MAQDQGGPKAQAQAQAVSEPQANQPQPVRPKIKLVQQRYEEVPRHRYFFGILPDAPVDEIRCGPVTFRKQTRRGRVQQPSGDVVAEYLPGGSARLTNDEAKKVEAILGVTGLAVDELEGRVIRARVTRLLPGTEPAAQWVWFVPAADMCRKGEDPNDWRPTMHTPIPEPMVIEQDGNTG